ncbi:hypothetical protein D3C72_1407810 [compost metagenome]
MADVGADQVRLVPAHQHAGEAQHDRAPAQLAADAVASVRTRGQPDPVEQRGQEYQRAHPQDGRLARQEVLEEEGLLGAGKVALIELDREQRQHGHADHQRPHRLPVPAKQREGGHGGHQHGLVVHIHPGAVAGERKPRAHHQQQCEGPVEPAQPAQERGFEVGLGRVHRHRGVGDIGGVSAGARRAQARVGVVDIGRHDIPALFPALLGVMHMYYIDRTCISPGIDAVNPSDRCASMYRRIG